MRRHQTIVVTFFAAIAAGFCLAPRTAAAQSAIAAPTPPQSVKWSPAPAVFEPGAQIAVMQGDPSKAGEEFTVRLRLPNGYKVKPHTHPTTEHVTVLAGTFLVGMGSTFDRTKMVALEPGGFVSAPGEHPHYAAARGETVVQIHAIGPFALTYVNPSDAPVAMKSQR
jgi:quercetin dioxygenase-like cupin family protein